MNSFGIIRRKMARFNASAIDVNCDVNNIRPLNSLLETNYNLDVLVCNAIAAYNKRNKPAICVDSNFGMQLMAGIRILDAANERFKAGKLDQQELVQIRTNKVARFISDVCVYYLVYHPRVHHVKASMGVPALMKIVYAKFAERYPVLAYRRNMLS